MATQLASVSDRRMGVRFPLDRELHYRILGRKSGRRGQEGKGRTVDISSSGVRFTSSRHLFEGDPVELSIDWPAQLDNRILLKLVITGRVVRSDGDVAAVAISAYEFRTSRRSNWAEAAEAELAPAGSPAG